jgi:hypothetical protein
LPIDTAIPPQSDVLPPADVSGTSPQFVGVRGTSTSGTGVVGSSVTGEGVLGSSQKTGVHGTTSSIATTDSAVLGEALVKGIGVSGTSRTGIGIYGKGETLAGQFDGAVTVNGVVSVNDTLNAAKDINAGGNINVTGDVILAGSDCAEEFLVSHGAAAGSVMVIDNDGRLCESAVPYDKRVAGVVSGAGAFRPAVIMGRGGGGEEMGASDAKRMPIALSGRVYCKADATYGSIEVGDLLTTSPTRGSAMKAEEAERAFGAVIGKALANLESGTGLIPILVALQ